METESYGNGLKKTKIDLKNYNKSWGFIQYYSIFHNEITAPIKTNVYKVEIYFIIREITAKLMHD